MIDPFSPICIKGLELRNRFVRSATHDGTANEAGMPTENSISIYRALGDGDIGLIITGYAFVSAHGQAVERQYGAEADKAIAGLRRVVEAVQGGGGKIALQIAHAGANCLCLQRKGAVCLAPSRIEGSSVPHRQMNEDEIRAIVHDFGAAAARGQEAGFDAVQLHGAHVYLLSQFLSPLTNRRTDIWGGSPEKRRRFHIEVVKEVRRRVGRDFPLLVKLGIMDAEPGGTTLAEGIAAAKEMIAAGVDAIEVSAGIGGDFMNRIVGEKSALENERPYFREGAAALRSAVSVPVIVGGGIRSLGMIQTILGAHEADIISMSRPFIREPRLLKRWLAGDRSPAMCITCNRCFRLSTRKQDLPDSHCWQELKDRKVPDSHGDGRNIGSVR